jgi:hypothetical protein
MAIDMLGQGIDWNHLAELGRGLSERVPQEWHLLTVWPPVVLLVLSLFIGLHGERLTRLLVLGAFIGLAAVLGQRLVAAMTLPLWPTVIFCGAFGGILAYMFYRWSLGLALAVLLALAAGAWSAGSFLDTKEILAVFSDAPRLSDSGGGGASSAAQLGDYLQYIQAVRERAMHLWSTVAAKPGAQQHLLLTMLAGAAVGLFAGLVLGRLAAILLTSVMAAAGLVFAGVSLAVWYQPSWGEYLSDNRRYVLLAGVVAVLLFVLRQLARSLPTTAVSAAAPAELASPQNRL